ncbi:SGNH/GDSL hydrolase family protein [Desulfonatronum thiodismutans]|uniref:SGNH/GDSL hydrolase family protein n=1 Tax=Desulfonatronum thiodismutans TaxID=159290 RepID=UPI00068E1D11|nr:GDSL-type esterase/lipase family protein [Desulfonatronum thiodismutans]
MQRVFIFALFFFTLCLTLAPQSSLASAELQLHKSNFQQPASPPAHDFGDNDPNVILALGDSITEGTPFVGRSETYPAHLQAMLGRTVINAGVGGARSRDGVARINGLLRRYKPGYVLIMYGANDVMERSAEEITKNLLTIANTATENKTIPILATVTPVDGPRIGRKNFILNLNEVITTKATESGYLVADTATAFGWEGQYLLSDGLHPNSAGMEILAQTYYEKILEAENENGGGGGGGGGCTIAAHGRLTGDWLIVLAGLFALFFLGRRGRNPHPAKNAEVITG